MEHAAAVVTEFLNLSKHLPSDTFISVPVKIVHEVVDGYKQAKRNKKGAESLVKHTCDLMRPIIRAAASHSREELGPIVNEELDTLPQLLREVQTAMLHVTGQGKIKGFLTRGDNKQLVDDLNAKLVQRLDTFKVKGLLNLQIRQNANEQTRQQDHSETRESFKQMHTRFDQLQITTSVTTRACPSHFRQAVSAHFTGRDDLVATAIAAVTGSSRPNLSFFGTGGIGKTSMAIAVAQHESCREHFSDYRYFIECEALTSASAVRSSILETLAGSSSPPTQGDPRQLLADMLSVNHTILLILDNFETPWNTHGQRLELTELLKEMAAMANVRLISTLRSDDAPASGDIAWTRLPVEVLKLSAARHLFVSINPGTDQAEHDTLDLLLNEVDCLPLAVKLLAEVKRQQSCSELLQRWQHTKTSLIKTERQGGTRLTSLDVSISLSLHSPLLDDAARMLLATICRLPTGIVGGRSKLRAMDLGFRDVEETLDALLEVALVTDNRTTNCITIATPVRTYVSSQTFGACEDQLKTYYITQIERWDQLRMDDAGYVESQDGLLAEVDNIRYFFEHQMRHLPSLKLGRAIFAFTGLEYLQRPSTQLITCLIDQLTQIGWEEQRPYCVLRLAHIYYMLSKDADAEHELRFAQAQFVENGDKFGAAQCLRSLGEIHRMLGRYTEAEHELQAAQTQYVEIGDRFGAAQCLRCLGVIHRLLGRSTEAEHTLQAAQVQSVEIGDRLGVAECLQNLAEICREQQRWQEGETLLADAESLLTSIGNRYQQAGVYLYRGRLYNAQGRYGEGLVQFTRSRDLFLSNDFNTDAEEAMREAVDSG